MAAEAREEANRSAYEKKAAADMKLAEKNRKSAENIKKSSGDALF